MHQLLLNKDLYRQFLQPCLPRAQHFVWIVTADIKDLHVEADGRFQPLLEVLDTLARRGVAIRLIHAREPGPRFREEFDRFEALIEGDCFERILCPRVHTKAVIVDGTVALVGSANLTGAGLGAKGQHRRNFEAGFVFDDAAHIAELMGWVDELYLGNLCQNCQRRAYCPDPIIDSIQR